jgi:hypothetical protein
MHPDSGFPGTAIRALVVAGAVMLPCAAPVQAQIQNPEPIATAWVSGIMTYRGTHKGQSYEMQANVVALGNPQNPGASAAFGVDDAGLVTFIGRTEYQPTQGLSTVRRLFETPTPPMRAVQGPDTSWSVPGR